MFMQREYEHEYEHQHEQEHNLGMISEIDFNIDIVPSTKAEKETLSLTNFLRYRIKKPNIESRISLPQPAHMT